MSFKEFKKEKTNELLESNNEFSKIRFTFSTSDTIQEILKYFVKDKGIDVRSIHKVLQDTSIAFTNKDDDKEDFLDVGYVLGYVSAKRPGTLFVVDLEKTRYYYIGVEADIIQKLKTEIGKLVKI
jgi:hypothetical protein